MKSKLVSVVSYYKKILCLMLHDSLIMWSLDNLWKTKTIFYNSDYDLARSWFTLKNS